jgi:hypothetical protein
MKSITPSKSRNGIQATVTREEKFEAVIPAPSFQTAVFKIVGTAPLVIHRFSIKTKNQMAEKKAGGKAAGNKKIREPKTAEDMFNDARYISKDGWDGFNASAIRAGMIRACSLVGYKMTQAKMSIFAIQDGWDEIEPQVPLIRIYGEPVMQQDMVRVVNGAPDVTVRPAYHDWYSLVRIRWDSDQFTLNDVANLLSRVGQQVGLCEGRPSSPNSCGMGWGLFEVEKSSNEN